MCKDGIPQHDISEVVTTAGDEEFQYLLDELNATHNLLLAYRLLHFHDKISNIKVNISSREKQLFKPIIRVFQNTKTINELLPVISEFVLRRRKITDTLEVFLYNDIITELIKKYKSPEKQTSLIWNTVKESLDGQDVAKRPYSWESEVFGILSPKKITEVCEQQFGTKPKHTGKSRRLIFDED